MLFKVIVLKKFLIIVALILIVGCTQAKDFKYGLEKINSLNSKYNTTMETYPRTILKIDSMAEEMNDLKKLQLESGNEQFNYVIDYRLLNLEAEKLYIESQKYGSAGTTKDGFACKPRPLIIESANLRNTSALKGFQAVELLGKFLMKYPDEAKSAGLSEKNALFLNATFYQISKDARRDSGIINQFCPENVTLEIYQQTFRKRTNLSEDFIKGLSYGDAVGIWKEMSGFK